MEVPQFRFNVFLHTFPEYNCSYTDEPIDWSTRGTKRPYFGSFCLCFGIVTISLYSICVSVLFKMRIMPVYKIMLFLAAVDISDVFGNSILFSIALFRGEVYCMHPTIHLYYAMFCQFFFMASSMTCILLAINRFGELLTIGIISSMFKGSRTWIVLFLFLPLSFLAVFFSPPMLFNSTYHLLLFNPMITEGRYIFTNYLNTVLSISMPCISFSIYVVMICSMYIKHGRLAKASDSDALNEVALRMIVQSGIIITIHMTTCVIYEVTQYIEMNEAIMYGAQIGWMSVHGSPPFVYIIFNEAVRNRVKSMLIFSISMSPTPKNRSLVTVQPIELMTSRDNAN